MRLLNLPREMLDFPLFRRSLVVVSVAAHVVIGLIVFGRILTTMMISSVATTAGADWLTLPIIVGVVHVGVSILADVGVIIRTVYWWHATQRQEQLDLLRTTLPDDRWLLRIFAAVNLMRGWHILQIDVALRVVVTVVAFSMAYFSGVQALASEEWQRAGLYASVAVCAAVSGVMYVRNPARRAQSTVNFSTWIALRTKDSVAAILIAVGGCLALRVVIGAVFLAVIYQSNVMLNLNSTLFSEPANAGVLVSYYIWFIGLALIMGLGSMYLYAAIDMVVENRALATLRSGT